MSQAAKPKRRYATRMSVEQRREQLLAAGLSVLDRDGYAALTIEAIAREADVTRPVVYSAYGSVDEMLSALLDAARDRALAQALHLFSDYAHIEDLAKWACELAVEFIAVVQADPQMWRPVLGLVRGAPPEVSERIEVARDLLCDQIAEGIKQRLPADVADVDAAVLARVFLGASEELARVALRNPSAHSVEQIRATYNALLSSVVAGAR